MDTYGLAAGHWRRLRRCQTIGVVLQWGLELEGPTKRRALLGWLMGLYEDWSVWKRLQQGRFRVVPLSSSRHHSFCC